MNNHFYLTSKDDLTIRSQNIIEDFGDIDKLLDYYKKNFTFLNVRNVGSFSNEELISFCEYLLSKDITGKTVRNIENPLDSEIKHCINLYESEKILLNVRTRNILKRYEIQCKYQDCDANKFEYIKSLFLKPFDYSLLYNSGSRAIQELKTLRYKISNSELKQDVQETQDEYPNEANIERCILIYESEKEFLSVRAKNVLDSFETHSHCNDSIISKFELIRELFLKPYNYYTLKNAGSKTIKEFQSLKEKLLSSNWTKEVDENLYLNKKNCILINKAFSTDLDETEIVEFFTDNEFSFSKLLCLMLLSNKKINDKFGGVLKSKFFCEPPLERKVIANELNCSIERVRQISNKICTGLIPNTINSIFKNIERKPYDIINSDEKNILLIENLTHFTFRSFEYTPNKELSRISFNHVYKKNYKLVDNLIQETHKSFKIPHNTLFISNKFIEETQFNEFLVWLDIQIYDFETTSFNYRLEVLIKRFYQEKNVSISNEYLKDLYSIVNQIKKEDIEIDEKISKKLNTRNLIDAIVNEVYLFLKEQKEAQTTKNILEYLLEKNYELDKQDLLRYLNKNKNSFSSFGTGAWTLKEWNNSNISGSFRDIVRNLLSNRNEPIHISELYDFINSTKKVSLNSIMSNLKAETEGTFNFFNCSYIGLSEKKYEDSWYQIPQFKARYLNGNWIKSINPIKEQHIIKTLATQLGYPEQHIVFLIERKRGKYS